MFDTMPIDPFVFQPERQLWLRTLFLHAVVGRREPVATAARILNISRSSAYRWRQQFLAGNESGLIDKRFGPSSVMEAAGLRQKRGAEDDE